MAATKHQDRTCWPVDTVCYKYNSLLQVPKQENHIIPIIPCHGGPPSQILKRIHKCSKSDMSPATPNKRKSSLHSKGRTQVAWCCLSWFRGKKPQKPQEPQTGKQKKWAWLRKSLRRVSLESVFKQCPAAVPHKSVGEEWFQRMFYKIVIGQILLIMIQFQAAFPDSLRFAAFRARSPPFDFYWYVDPFGAIIQFCMGFQQFRLNLSFAWYVWGAKGYHLSC